MRPVPVQSGNDRAGRRTALAWVRGGVHTLRTEGSGPEREAAAIALGVFIGASPFYGAHLLLCWIFGRLFRLNRLKVYLAANISNPLVAPWLIFSELQTGAWVRRGQVHALTLDTVRRTDPWVFGLDVLAGSVILGGFLALAAAGATYAAARRRSVDDVFAALALRAADRYVSTSITAWEFARAKLQRDPVYRAVLCGGWLTSGRSTVNKDQIAKRGARMARRDDREYREYSREEQRPHPGCPAREVVLDQRGQATSGGTLIDIGCGQGLMLVLLAERARAARSGTWNGSAAPEFERLVGIETRTRVARLARIALGSDAAILNADAGTVDLEPCDAVLLFDVLHMMPLESQDALLATLAARLRSGGTILVREADAASGWRFTVVAIGNRLKAIALGQWTQRFHFRTAAAWTECFARHGFSTTMREMGSGTPFGNVLFSLTARGSRADEHSSGRTA
jgi:uncharacterized protein (DUF2062 family)/SAM-dependent methyltransferase